MKRFWLVLLSLGYIIAFSTSAFAIDVKLSGSYFVAGMYLDKTNFQKNVGPSTAFYYQNLRLKTEFVVSPGLKLVTRADIMERIWGAARSTPSSAYADTGLFNSYMSAGTEAENENIAFDELFVEYMSPIGQLKVGYQQSGIAGTVFGDNNWIMPKISFGTKIGNLSVGISYAKQQENSKNAKSVLPYGTQSDVDDDSYSVGVNYGTEWGSFGLIGNYSRYALLKYGTGFPPPSKLNQNFLIQLYTVIPYAKVNIGPVKLQAEIDYLWGEGKYEESFLTGKNLKAGGLLGWIDATVDLGPVYLGATFAYVSGDDPNTTDKLEGGVINGGRDWNPCLIMFNWQDRGKYYGTIGNYAPGNVFDRGRGMDNAWFYQGRVGVRPIDKLDIQASVSFASADKKDATMATVVTLPLGGLTTLSGPSNSSDYGWEVDVTGTYKINNNLTYMLGVGYMFTGDYYKGLSDTNQINDDFMVINKLTLTF
jgi:hypothetical protein